MPGPPATAGALERILPAHMFGVFMPVLCAGAGAAVRQLAALGVAASWRLGRWAPLEGYLELAREDSGAGGAELGLDAEERWEVRLGRLLAAMHRRCAQGCRHTSGVYGGDFGCELTVCIFYFRGMTRLQRPHASGLCCVFTRTSTTALVWLLGGGQEAFLRSRTCSAILSEQKSSATSSPPWPRLYRTGAQMLGSAHA